MVIKIFIKSSFWVCTWGLFFATSSFAASTPSKEDLLKGAPVPIRREFPLDQKVNPCSDFYNYTCNKVVSSFKLPEDRSYHTFSFSDSSERLLQGKKNFLKILIKQKKPTKRAAELRDVYQACMSPEARKAEEQAYVKRELEAIDKIKDSKELYALMARRMTEPQFGFLEYGTLPNQDDPSFDDVIVAADVMSLPERSYYDNKAVVADLESLVKAFLQATGFKGDLNKRAKNIVAFEKAFAQAQPLPAEMRDRVASRNPITRADFEKKYPNLQLAVFLEQITARTQFRNLTPEALAFINDAMTNTPLDTWKDIVRFHSLTTVMDDAYPEFFKKSFDFRKKHLGGPDKRPSRDERCTRLLMNQFTMELDAELLPLLFPDFPEEQFRQMVEKIRTSLIAGLEANTWLSPEGKAAAIKKMQVARLMVVKPRNVDEWNFNPEADYDATKPLANSQLLRKKTIEKELSELKDARKRNRWLMGPLTVNAYYVPMDNTFVLPIGILQYPLYDPSLPETVNLAAIGTIIGHELGHGIDDKGAKYDEEGRFKNWMSEKDLSEFKKRGESFVARFDKIGHNGKLTLGENIGDHVGLTAAYRAAFSAGKGSVQAKKDFFIQYGRAWCQVIRPKFKDMLLKTDPHALGHARVNEQVKNLPGFQEAFACTTKDKLYLSPKDQIHVW